MTQTTRTSTNNNRLPISGVLRQCMLLVSIGLLLLLPRSSMGFSMVSLAPVARSPRHVTTSSNDLWTLSMLDPNNALNKDDMDTYSFSANKDTATASSEMNAVEMAALYLQRARQARLEVAALTGQTLEQVEAQALADKQAQVERAINASAAAAAAAPVARNSGAPSVVLEVPDTAEEQIYQAKMAVEAAFADNLTRQIVRLALIPDGETLWEKERSWPGGAQQMYREAAGPLTRGLLSLLRCHAQNATSTATTTMEWTKPPTVSSHDVWDFDGSALITAQSSIGPLGDVQALVQPNTDNRYTRDIAALDAAMGRQRLVLLVNPFWRNLSSWGFNLLAPRAQTLAQEAIFDAGFVETYCLLQKSVRGEDCVALKVYPYDWQMYAYLDETNGYSSYTTRTAVRLGSTVLEPTAVDFAARLAERPEFSLGKTMRRLQSRNPPPPPR
jgi:Domain of unknown function (DUF1995)